MKQRLSVQKKLQPDNISEAVSISSNRRIVVIEYFGMFSAKDLAVISVLIFKKFRNNSYSYETIKISPHMNEI